MTTDTLAIARPAAPAMTPLLTVLLAATCGLLAANLYYAQPLAGPIAAGFGMDPKATGLIVTLTQMGYCTGLLLVVPLGDLIESRRLIVTMVCLAACAMLCAALAPSAVPFLFTCYLSGLASVGAQIAVPFGAALATEATRGRVVGNIMSGLMCGIMLARPVSSLLAQVAGWHAMFYVSAVALLLLGLVLSRTLPRRMPVSTLGYSALIASMGKLALRTPVLQRRAFYHALMFAAFSLFWTVTPLLLSGPLYRLSQGGIALFALAGVAGVVAAPIAGRVADRGWTRPATGLSMLLVASAFAVTHFTTDGSMVSLGLLAAAGILVDFGVTSHLVLSQRMIYSLSAEHRSRLNGLFMATFFAGGAAGSAIGGWSWGTGAWGLASLAGTGFAVAALLAWTTELRR